MATPYQTMIIDVMNRVHSNWWSMRDSVTSSGIDNSLERGFLLELVTLAQRYPEATPVLAWDGRPDNQLRLHPTYKEGRADKHADRPPDWHQRCQRLREALTEIVPTLYDPMDEADAEIARLVKVPPQGRLLLVSTDRDLLQLLSHSVDLYRPGQPTAFYTTLTFAEEYGFRPNQFALYRALTGDRSDNIAGLPHFPARVAARLVATFGSADLLFRALGQPQQSPAMRDLTPGQRVKLQTGEPQVRSNLRLLDLRAVTGNPHLCQPSGNWDRLLNLAARLELEGVVNGLEWELTKARRGASEVIDDTGKKEAVVESPQATVGPPSALPETIGRSDLADAPGPGLPAKGAAPAEAPEISRSRLDLAGPRTPLRRLVLAPGWAERLERGLPEENAAVQPPRVLPLAREFFARDLIVSDDPAGSQRLVDLAKQLPVAWIGIDLEYQYRRPGVLVKQGSSGDYHWYDPRSIEPLLLAVTLVERQRDGRFVLYRFVIDVRNRAAASPLGDLFRMPVPFIAHFAQAELFCLWQLGLPTPALVWDTWAAERAFLLGLYHSRYKKEQPGDELEERVLGEEAADDISFSCKLIVTCTRRGVTHPFAGDKDRLQQSFLVHERDQQFTREQLEYSAADAEAAARLYPAQTQVAIELGCLDHLTTLEMPWAVTNASMIWSGVRVDQKLCEQLRTRCDSLVAKLYEDLAETGISNVGSTPQLHEFFRCIGLLEAFRVRDGYTFDDDHLERVEDRHEAIAKVRALRKLGRLRSDKLLTGELIGADGRLHPEHRQMGADTTRNSMRWPNLAGIGRALRPLVVPEDGSGLGEVDLSQIEVGIAAAYFNDADLIGMFNGRDVYTAMVKLYYARDLPASDLTIPDKPFKRKYKHLRDRMKVFTLATIYNITPHGLALQLGITEERAAAERDRFLQLFPKLAQALREASDCGALRGYAYLCSGLRRWRARVGRPSAWEVNWLRNCPVQGSAGVVFKAAGNRLYRRYQYYGARLVLPMHDAFIFEAPKKHLRTVAKITAEVMRSTVQEYFPVLDPQVEINIDHPHCWNKDGKYRSLQLWMIDPELAAS
jgi:DNA polymerase-1